MFSRRTVAVSPRPKSLCAATHCRSTVYHCDGIFRARDPNAFAQPRVAETKFTTATAFFRANDTNTFALPRIVERSHRLIFMILPHFIQLQLCFQAAHPFPNPPFGFLGHVYMKRNTVTLRRPLLKERAHDQTHLCNHAT